MAGFLTGLGSPSLAGAGLSNTASASTPPSGNSNTDVQNAAGLSGGTTPQQSSPIDDGTGAMNQLVSMRQASNPFSGSDPTHVDYTSALQNLAGNTGTGGTTSGQSGGTTTSGNWDALLADAKSWEGTPYAYGGTTKAGVDCSGFTEAVYGSQGINIGRTTGQQMQHGQVVGADGNWSSMQSQLQPGDLLFYGEKGASGPNAHVVMYIGNGQVIQAAHTGTDVSIGPMFSAASSDEPFAGARRYLSASPSGAAPVGGSGQLGQLAGGITDQTSFANSLLEALGDTPNSGNVAALTAWENAEGGNWHNPDTFNPLNTTLAYDGSHGTNSVGVQAFKSWLDGLTATYNVLHNGLYGNILSALAGNNPQAIEQAVAGSKWGTGNFNV